MVSLSYYQLYKMNKLEARKLLVKIFKETENVTQTAMRLSCSRNTIRKFVKRYFNEQSLDDLLRRPKELYRMTWAENRDYS